MFTISGTTVTIDPNIKGGTDYVRTYISSTDNKPNRRLVQGDTAVDVYISQDDWVTMCQLAELDHSHADSLWLKQRLAGKQMSPTEVMEYAGQFHVTKAKGRLTYNDKAELFGRIVRLLKESTPSHIAFASAMFYVFNGYNKWGPTSTPSADDMIRGPKDAQSRWERAVHLAMRNGYDTSGLPKEVTLEPSDTALGVSYLRAVVRKQEAVQAALAALYGEVPEYAAHYGRTTRQLSPYIRYHHHGSPDLPDLTDDHIASFKKLERKLVRWFKTTRKV